MKTAAFFILLFSLSTIAADTPKTAKAKPTSQFNTQVYESESEESSFEAVVKVVREIRGETEVAFQGQQGFFTVPNGEQQNLLQKSQQKKFPVKVHFNSRSRQILKVEAVIPGGS